MREEHHDRRTLLVQGCAKDHVDLGEVESALPVAYSMLEMRNYHRSDVSRVECRQMTVTSIVCFLLSPVSRSVSCFAV